MATVIITAVLATGFRRCGKKFTKEPKTIVEGTDVTPAQLKILRNEKMLVVKDIAPANAQTPPPPPPPPGGSGGDDLSAKERIEKIKTLSMEECKGLFKGETRVTVKDALKARIKELAIAAK